MRRDLCDVLTHPDSIALALQRAQGGYWLPQELQARRENQHKAQVSLEHQLECLTEAYLNNVIPLPDAERQRWRQDLEQKLPVLNNQAQQLEANVDRQAELAGLVSSIQVSRKGNW